MRWPILGSIVLIGAWRFSSCIVVALENRSLAPEANRRGRDLAIIGVSTIIGATTGVGASIVVALAVEELNSRPLALAAGVLLAATVAWGLARVLRGEAVVSACAAGGVTAFAVLMWLLSRSH